MLVRWILDVFVSESEQMLTLFRSNWPIKIQLFFTILPNEYKHNVTCGIFRRSNKSAVWKISSSGTPYFLIAAWNLCKFLFSINTSNFIVCIRMFSYLCTFSINWKLVPRSWIFFTLPGVNLLANLHNTWPSRKMSSYCPDGTFSPKTSKTHFKTSASCSLLRGCKNIKKRQSIVWVFFLHNFFQVEWVSEFHMLLVGAS